MIMFLLGESGFYVKHAPSSSNVSSLRERAVMHTELGGNQFSTRKGVADRSCVGPSRRTEQMRKINSAG